MDDRRQVTGSDSDVAATDNTAAAAAAVSRLYITRDVVSG